MRHAAGNEKDVTGFDRHRFEQPQHLFEILGFDDALEPLPAYRVLKTEIQTGFDPLAVPEDDITLRFAGIRIQMLPRKFDRGVALQLEPDRRVEELQQKSGFFPEALKMFAPEQKLRIPSYEFGECDRFSVEFEKRDAFRRPARIDCGRVGEQPVLREMRILRRNGSGEFVEPPSARIGAPDAVGQNPAERRERCVNGGGHGTIPSVAYREIQNFRLRFSFR